MLNQTMNLMDERKILNISSVSSNAKLSIDTFQLELEFDCRETLKLFWFYTCFQITFCCYSYQFCCYCSLTINLLSIIRYKSEGLYEH